MVSDTVAYWRPERTCVDGIMFSLSGIAPTFTEVYAGMGSSRGLLVRETIRAWRVEAGAQGHCQIRLHVYLLCACGPQVSGERP